MQACFIDFQLTPLIRRAQQSHSLRGLIFLRHNLDCALHKTEAQVLDQSRDWGHRATVVSNHRNHHNAKSVYEANAS